MSAIYRGQTAFTHELHRRAADAAHAEAEAFLKEERRGRYMPAMSGRMQGAPGPYMYGDNYGETAGTYVQDSRRSQTSSVITEAPQAAALFSGSVNIHTSAKDHKNDIHIGSPSFAEAFPGRAPRVNPNAQPRWTYAVLKSPAAMQKITEAAAAKIRRGK